MRGERFDQVFRAAQLHLEGWGARPDDRIVIMADTGTDRTLLDACHAAAVALGADVTLVMYSGRREPFQDVPRAAEAAVLNSTFYLVIMSGRWTYSSSMARVMADPRHKNIRNAAWDGDADGLNHFVELVPSQELRERTKRARALVDAATSIRVTSALGTDITMERGDPKTVLAFAPPGQVAIAAPPKSVNGTLVLRGAFRSRSPGPNGIKRLIQWPIHIEFTDGYITHIAEDNPDAIALAAWLRRWDDPEVYRFSHINLGLDQRVRLEYLDNLAVHFNYGGLLFGVGGMNTPLFGHEDVLQAKAHMELQLTGASYFLDGRQILRDGEFVPETGLRYATAAEPVLTPAD